MVNGMLIPSLFHGQKVKLRWSPMKENFVRQFQLSRWSCTSVSVLYTTLIFSFCLVLFRKHSQPRKKCFDEILGDEFYINKYLKGFIIAVWLMKCVKLSEDGN